MAVPESIRQVPRPSNTVVIDSGSNGLKRYAVHSRTKVVYTPGRNPRPVNGPVIGHIIAGKFVPVVSGAKLAPNGPEYVSYGVISLVHEELRGLDDELFRIFDVTDSCLILVLAMLRIERKGIKLSRIRSAYNKSLVSILYPGLPLSANKISAFLERLGQDITKQQAFFHARLEAVCENDHIIIDGTLKQNTSRVNDLSEFSRKARVKGCQDISVLYAYNLEKREPLCAQVFPGNMIDARAYRAFVQDNKIERGLLITDKGFPPKEINDVLAKHAELHFLTPLKRSDVRIAKNKMLDFNDFLRNIDKRIRCKKQQLATGRFLYAFKDSVRAAMEDNSFMDLQRKSGNYDKDLYDKKGGSFGTIVFESDIDLSCEEIYKIYEERWQLEMLFDCYKNSLNFGITRVQSDYAVRGSEFIDFIATVLTRRIVDRMAKAGVLDDNTYGDVIDDLRGCWRSSKTQVNTKPSVQDEQWCRLLKKDEDLLVTLGLATLPDNKPALPSKQRGRPKKETTTGASSKDETPRRKPGRPRTKPIIYGPPRRRGRPRKVEPDSAL